MIPVYFERNKIPNRAHQNGQNTPIKTWNIKAASSGSANFWRKLSYVITVPKSTNINFYVVGGDVVEKFSKIK